MVAHPVARFQTDAMRGAKGSGCSVEDWRLRGYTWAELQLQGTPTHVGNVHLESSRAECRQRQMQLRQRRQRQRRRLRPKGRAHRT